MANVFMKFLEGKKKKTPQLGGSNPQNIDALVAAGILTAEEGKKAKERMEGKSTK